MNKEIEAHQFFRNPASNSSAKYLLVHSDMHLSYYPVLQEFIKA